MAPLADVSHRGAVAGAAGPEAACGEPDDVGVDRDLDDGVAGLSSCRPGLTPSTPAVTAATRWGTLPLPVLLRRFVGVPVDDGRHPG